MGDEPFACPQPGCGMRFVNEDHLSVHKLKHEMSLSLTPGTRFTNNLIVDFSADQTPTPTKFLRNCEEIGLFSELTPSKNPFEDAFKKATQDNLSHTSTEATVDVQTLHTPIPPSVTLPADSSQPSHFIPLPGPTTDSGSTITSTHVSPSQPNNNIKPTDTEVAIDLTMSSDKLKITKVEEITSPVEVVQSPPHSEPEDSLSAISSSSSGETLTKREQTQVMVAKPTTLPTLPPVTQHPAMVLTSPTQEMVGVMPAVAAAAAMSPQIVTSPMGSQAQQQQQNIALATAATIRPHYLMQVMLQLPDGQTVPVQIPAALTAGSPVTAAPTAFPPPPQLQPAINQAQPQQLALQPQLAAVPVKQETMVIQPTVSTLPLPPAPAPISRAAPPLPAPPAPAAAAITSVPLASPVAEVSTTTSSQNNASAITKQKLKAAITQNVQQSVLQNNMRVMSEAVERVIAAPAQRPQTLLKTSPGGGILLQSAPASTVTSPNTVQTQAADTSTPFGSKRQRKSSEDDPDERRRKFLERNRAAAARCRNKRKQWIANLERKADDINGVNGKLQNEISQLRAEVAQLKSLLLEHKDCPVFVQQRDSGQINLETVRVQNMEVDSESDTMSLPPSTELITVNLSSSSTPATSSSSSNCSDLSGLGGGGGSQIVPQTIISVLEDSKLLVKHS